MKRISLTVVAMALLAPVLVFTASAAAQPAAAVGGTGDGPPIDITCVSTLAPAIVHVRAAVPKDLPVSPLDTRYEWDFGDPGSKYNHLPGWNAAHIYDQPGTYTITLTVRLAGGKELKRSTWVRIAPDTRRKIHVSADGNDRFDGATPGRAVGTAGRAIQLAQNGDAWILFRKGDTFEMPGSVSIGGRGIRIGNYGRPAGGEDLFKDGVPLKPPPGVAQQPAAPSTQPRDALPILKKVAGGDGKSESIFVVWRSCEDLLIEGIEFDSVWDFKSQYGNKKIPARAFTVGGKNIAFRWCSFRNLTDAINTELKPVGVLVSECNFTIEIRGYCIYSIGSDHVYVGNVMRHSQTEHLIRASEPGVTHVLVAYNDLRRQGQYKGSVEFRHASWFYVAANWFRSGTLRVGPQEQDKNAVKDWENIKCEWGVIQDNRLDQLFLNVRLGTYHLVFRNNVIRATDEDWAMIIACDKPGYDQVRKAGDIRIAHNTVINEGKKGMFIFVQGQPQGLTIRQNVYIAPNVSPGGSNAGIYATQDLDGFEAIEGNIFPTGPGGLHRIQGKVTDRNTWQKQPQVKAERYSPVPLDANDNVPLKADAGAYMGNDKSNRKE